MSDSPLDYLFSLQHFGIKFGLGNIRAILAALDHPERAFVSVHIAGTNGKGSVTAMIDAALRAAGHRSARYTSPHLVDLTERFVVDGQPVASADFVAVVASIRDVVAQLMTGGSLDVHPTFFEVTTAAAFELFRRSRVDVAVCEVGLGGRLDATNVLSPAVTAITTIARDHEQYLGRKLSQIAGEKAGIIKPGVPVVLGRIDDEAGEVIEAIAARAGAPIVHAHDGVNVESLGTTREGSQTVELSTSLRHYGKIDLALAGAHQVDNAIVAVRVLEVLHAGGLRVDPVAIAAGLATVRWPGRLQYVSLPDGRTLLLDAAHNPAGARALAAFLNGRGQRHPLVLAVMQDKDAREILRALLPSVGALVITRASNPRSTEPLALAEIARNVAPNRQVIVQESPRAALDAAWELAPDIVVAGSIFLLGDVMKELGAS